VDDNLEVLGTLAFLWHLFMFYSRGNKEIQGEHTTLKVAEEGRKNRLVSKM
jgi:hypothetical protein